VDEAKNAHTPHDAFSLFISDDILNIILTHTNKKIHDYLFTFNGKVQKWMRRTSLDELCAVIGFLIYGGVFESSHEHKESLYKMDGTGRSVFLVVIAKNRFRFLLSVMRFDDKSTRTDRRLEDKMAAFREMWDMFIGLCKSFIWLVRLSASMNIYFHSEEDVDSGNICLKKPSMYGIKIWMMCDCATKYMMNAKVCMRKENNEVTRGLASDIVCTLVQPISGQDRGGRHVTTDNFFTSVDLANQVKNKKLTLVGTMKQNKREIPQEFKPARQRDENLFIFGFTKDLTFVSYVPKKNKSVVLLSSLHHDSAL
jgi:hypothetical protein